MHHLVEEEKSSVSPGMLKYRLDLSRSQYCGRSLLTLSSLSDDGGLLCTSNALRNNFKSSLVRAIFSTAVTAVLIVTPGMMVENLSLAQPESMWRSRARLLQMVYEAGQIRLR